MGMRRLSAMRAMMISAHAPQGRTSTRRRPTANWHAWAFFAAGLTALLLLTGCQMNLRLMTDAQVKGESLDRVQWNRADSDLKVTHRGVFKGSLEAHKRLTAEKRAQR